MGLDAGLLAIDDIYITTIITSQLSFQNTIEALPDARGWLH